MFCLLMHLQVAEISFLNVTIITIILEYPGLKSRLSQKPFSLHVYIFMGLQITLQASLVFKVRTSSSCSSVLSSLSSISALNASPSLFPSCLFFRCFLKSARHFVSQLHFSQKYTLLSCFTCLWTFR